jgi:tRNA (guanosine-2'-O-)-methyltransferase
MLGPAAARPWRDLISPVPPHPLDTLITAERARTYRQVLARRTGRLCVVVEECHDPHNATAIIRTCDAFGVHRVAIVTGRNSFKVNRRISQGSHFYVDVQHFTDIAACYAALRGDGFRILATDLATGAVASNSALCAQAAAGPLALVFGNEGAGVTPAASAGADGHVLVPMAGFPQSLNLSVSVAALVYGLRCDALGADAPGDLPPAQQQSVYDRWVRQHVGEDRAAAVFRRHSDAHGDELDTLGGDP